MCELLIHLTEPGFTGVRDVPGFCFSEHDVKDFQDGQDEKESSSIL
jgi:hypothetical protein